VEIEFDVRTDQDLETCLIQPRGRLRVGKPRVKERSIQRDASDQLEKQAG